MPLISLTPKRIHRARVIADLALDSIRGKYNYTQLQRHDGDSYYYGALLEQAVMEYLTQQNKRAIYAPSAGRPDNGDIELCLAAGFSVMADAKCAAEAHHLYLMMPLAQAQHHNYSLYIAGKREHDDLIDVVGWAYVTDFRAPNPPVAVKVPTVWIPLIDLRPMSELLELLEDGEPTEDYDEVKLAIIKAAG